jgi:hypothetical protein
VQSGASHPLTRHFCAFDANRLVRRFLELVVTLLIDFEDNTAAGLTLYVSDALRCAAAAFSDAEDVPG